jgi:hypothetical protein
MLSLAASRPAELQRWLSRTAPQSVPLDAVVAELRRAGKHHAAPELLEALAQARAALPPGDRPLRRFLDTALDMYDGRFDTTTYLALHDLPMPTMAGHGSLGFDMGRAAVQCDLLVMLLVADLLRFELAALDGTTHLLPRRRPTRDTVAERCTLGMWVLGPAMMRLGLEAHEDPRDPIATARRVCETVAAGQTDEERRMLAVTLLPVSAAHDESLFVRVLQSYETSFALIGVQLEAAIVAAASGDAARAVRALRAADQALREARPLSALLATIEPDAFREHPDRVSVVRLRSYATVQRRCRAAPTVRDAVARCPDPTGEIRAALAAVEASFPAPASFGRFA